MMSELFAGNDRAAATDGGEEMWLPEALRPWLKVTDKKCRKYLKWLTSADQNELTTLDSISNHTGINASTIDDYISDETRLKGTV